ncbi:uncharacterized protein LOC144124438 [Amblyomma americanum]
MLPPSTAHRSGRLLPLPSGTMFSSIFGRKRAPVEQPTVVQESQQGDFVVFESPAIHTQPLPVQEHPVKSHRIIGRSSSVVSEVLTDSLGPKYNVTKLASGEILLELLDITQVGAPPDVASQQQHRCLGIDGVPFQLNVAQPVGDVDALLRRLRTMGADLSWTEYDYVVERRILRDYA